MYKKLAISFVALLNLLSACASDNSSNIMNNVVDQNLQAASKSNVKSSFIRLSSEHPEIQAYIKNKGYNSKNLKVGLTGDIIYTSDDWKTTKVSKIQYLINGDQGAILEVPAGTEVEFAVHAFLCSSYDGLRSCDFKDEMWVNNKGSNLKTKTTDK